MSNESFLLDPFGKDPQGDPEVALATLDTIWLRVLAPRTHENRHAAAARR